MTLPSSASAAEVHAEWSGGAKKPSVHVTEERCIGPALDGPTIASADPPSPPFPVAVIVMADSAEESGAARPQQLLMEEVVPPLQESGAARPQQPLMDEAAMPSEVAGVQLSSEHPEENKNLDSRYPIPTFYLDGLASPQVASDHIHIANNIVPAGSFPVSDPRIGRSNYQTMDAAEVEVRSIVSNIWHPMISLPTRPNLGLSRRPSGC